CACAQVQVGPAEALGSLLLGGGAPQGGVVRHQAAGHLVGDEPVQHGVVLAGVGYGDPHLEEFPRGDVHGRHSPTTSSWRATVVVSSFHETTNFSTPSRSRSSRTSSKSTPTRASPASTSRASSPRPVTVSPC